MINRILLIVFAAFFVTHTCNAAISSYMQQCVNQNVEKISEYILQNDFEEDDLYELFDNKRKLSELENIIFATGTAKVVIEKCAYMIPEFLKEYDKNNNQTISFNFTVPRKKLTSGQTLTIPITINISDVLKQLRSPVALVVWPGPGGKNATIMPNKTDLTVIKPDDERLQDYWFSRECSDYYTTSLDSNSGFSKAALDLVQKKFPKAEAVHIDLPQNKFGDLAFPGAIIMDIDNSTKSQLYYTTDITQAYEDAKTLATNLKAKQSCADSHMAVYVVGLKSSEIEEETAKKIREINKYNNEQYDSGDNSDGWSAAGAVVGVGMIVSSIVVGFLTKDPGKTFKLGKWGWRLLIGGASIAAGTTALNMFVDWDIADSIEEVVVLSEPLLAF